MVATNPEQQTEQQVEQWQGDVNQLRGLVSERAITGETMLLNMGPHHPSTHGVLRLLLELDGEEIVTCLPDIGFLHTGIEKNIESKTYEKGITLTDRMDYLTPFSNNVAFCLAIEKMGGIDVPPRASALRVLWMELWRVASHCVWLGTHALDMGAMSVFLYAFREREKVLEMYEMVSGQRMMGSYARPGGLWRDVPPEFLKAARDFVPYMYEKIDDYERLLTGNPIWTDRTKGIGVIEPEDALQMGLTGASLRASGVNYDIRKAMPYCGYENYEFDVPLGEYGDVFDRYIIRMEEMRQSLRIITQVLDTLPDGPVRTDNRKFAPPPRSELGQSMEAVIHHFKLWTEGFSLPDEEVFVAIESPRGEISCYLHGTGGNKPRRVHFKTPSFICIQAIKHVAPGHMIADLVGIIGSFDFVLGDSDR